MISFLAYHPNRTLGRILRWPWGIGRITKRCRKPNQPHEYPGVDFCSCFIYIFQARVGHSPRDLARVCVCFVRAQKYELHRRDAAARRVLENENETGWHMAICTHARGCMVYWTVNHAPKTNQHNTHTHSHVQLAGGQRMNAAHTHTLTRIVKITATTQDKSTHVRRRRTPSGF